MLSMAKIAQIGLEGLGTMCEPSLRPASHYAQVERRSVAFLDQTISRGEAFGLKKHIKIIHLKPLASHSVKPQRTSPKAKPHTICKNVKSLLGT